MKSEIIKLRKKIFKNLKSRARSYEVRNKELLSYQKDQDTYSRRSFDISNMEELTQKAIQSNFIFLGDFHTFDQNIRNVLRIVKLLTTQNCECILALEMISSEHQLFIDAYLERHLTDLEFLESINYTDSWRFPWTHYKLIFELAKEHNLKVIGLNKEGSLADRDRYAASLLTKAMLEKEDAKILTLYGELHITKNKIPKLISEFYPEANPLVIHQNLDEVYWKLIKQDMEQGIVKFTENEFCIISAPPWIKYESMIYWYENLVDDPDFDIHEYIIETGAKTFVDDTKENFLSICQELVSHLELEIDPEELEDFNLYDHSNLEFVEKRLNKLLSPTLFNFYQELISSNRSFRFPNSATFYCSNYSMNRISYLAGIHILHYFLKDQKINTSHIINSKSSKKRFILFCYEALFAYFFSKVINPHRKCDMYSELKKRSDTKSELAIYVLDSQKFNEHLKGKKLIDLYESALIVGHILGEYLYQGITNSKSNKIHFIIENLSDSLFFKLKQMLLKDQDYQNHSKRYF